MGRRAVKGITKITVWIKDAPAEASNEEIALFIADALGTMGGCRRPPGGNGADDPGDPMFGSLEVKTIMLGETKYQIKEEL